MNKPNVLIYFVDQQRGNTAPPYNLAITPNLDKFAKEGVAFSQAHTIAPHCAPSRASFFSGLYPAQHGVWNNVSVGNALTRGLYDGITLFSEDFQKAGYRTYYGGKWHVSHYEGPLHRGFDICYQADKKVYSGQSNNTRPFTNEWDKFEGRYENKTQRGEGEILRDGYKLYTHYGVTEKIRDESTINTAIELITNRAEKDKEYGMDKDSSAPWFQVISTNSPHDPYFVEQKYLDMYDINDIELPPSYYDRMEDKPALYRKTAEMFWQLSEEEQKQSIRHYLALCTYQDECFGRVMDALEKSGEADNTIVLYVSDHGDYLGDHGIWCKGLPCFEGAYHIPALIRYPNMVKNPGRVVEDFVSITDIAPTLMDMCELYDYKNREIMGISLKDYLLDKTPQQKHTELYTQSNGNELYGIQRSVRNEKWKFVYNGFDYDEFYDLENDPHEMHNIYNDYKNSPELKEMCKKLWKFAKDTDDVCINQYIMVGLATYGPGIVFEEDSE